MLEFSSQMRMYLVLKIYSMRWKQWSNFLMIMTLLTILHHGSLVLTRAWFHGWISTVQDSCLFPKSPTLLGMNTIQFATAIMGGLFCVMQRLSKGGIIQERKMGSGIFHTSLRKQERQRLWHWCIAWQSQFTERGRLLQWIPVSALQQASLQCTSMVCLDRPWLRSTDGIDLVTFQATKLTTLLQRRSWDWQWAIGRRLMALIFYLLHNRCKLRNKYELAQHPWQNPRPFNWMLSWWRVEIVRVNCSSTLNQFHTTIAPNILLIITTIAAMHLLDLIRLGSPNGDQQGNSHSWLELLKWMLWICKHGFARNHQSQS